MIVLEKLDLEARRAVFRALTQDGAEATAALRRAVESLPRLRIDRATLRMVDGRRVEIGTDASVAGPKLDIRHRLEWNGSIPISIGAVPHRRQSLETMSLYSALVLSTRGPLHGVLHQIQVAVYELCVNALEHGRPFGPGTELVLGLAMEPRAIAGWLHDGCQRFDPLARSLRPVGMHAAERHARGYGLHMIRRILPNLHHEFDSTGNLLKFRKEIVP